MHKLIDAVVTIIKTIYKGCPGARQKLIDAVVTIIKTINKGCPGRS